MSRRALITVAVCVAIGALVWAALITLVLVVAHLAGTA